LQGYGSHLNILGDFNVAGRDLADQNLLQTNGCAGGCLIPVTTVDEIRRAHGAIECGAVRRFDDDIGAANEGKYNIPFIRVSTSVSRT